MRGNRPNKRRPTSQEIQEEERSLQRAFRELEHQQKTNKRTRRNEKLREALPGAVAGSGILGGLSKRALKDALQPMTPAEKGRMAGGLAGRQSLKPDRPMPGQIQGLPGYTYPNGWTQEEVDQMLAQDPALQPKPSPRGPVVIDPELDFTSPGLMRNIDYTTQTEDRAPRSTPKGDRLSAKGPRLGPTPGEAALAASAAKGAAGYLGSQGSLVGKGVTPRGGILKQDRLPGVTVANNEAEAQAAELAQGMGQPALDPVTAAQNTFSRIRPSTQQDALAHLFDPAETTTTAKTDRLGTAAASKTSRLGYQPGVTVGTNDPAEAKRRDDAMMASLQAQGDTTDTPMLPDPNEDQGTAEAIAKVNGFPAPGPEMAFADPTKQSPPPALSAAAIPQNAAAMPPLALQDSIAKAMSGVKKAGAFAPPGGDLRSLDRFAKPTQVAGAAPAFGKPRTVKDYPVETITSPTGDIYPPAPDPSTIYPEAPEDPSTFFDRNPLLTRGIKGFLKGGVLGAVGDVGMGLLGDRLGPGFDKALSAAERFKVASMADAIGGSRGATARSMSNPDVTYSSLGDFVGPLGNEGLRRNDKYGYTQVVGPDGAVRGIRYDDPNGGGILGSLSRALGGWFGSDRPSRAERASFSGKAGLY